MLSYLALWGLLLGVAASRLLDQYDAVVAARCVAKCWTPQKPHNEGCANKCVAETWTKPGSCPERHQLTEFETACLRVCDRDAECPGITRCCPNDCGVTCQSATGLADVPGLPRIPENVTVTERRRGRTVLVEWSISREDGGALVYVLEERHHLGHQFVASRLTPWAFKHRSLRPRASFKFNVVRPGRWYQFRVVAVSEKGTLGFSRPSDPFTLSIAPKAARKPQKLSVEGVHRLNGTLWAELTWEHPFSDLPIQRYKVFWSQKLQTASSPLMSVLVHHQTVSKDTTRFTLKNLELDSMYFLQVQALSQYGMERLKSEKAAMVFDPKHYKNLTEVVASSSEGGRERNAADRVSNLRVHKVFWSGDQLIARISWMPVHSHRTHYTISWWSGPCQGTPSGKRVHLAATTENNTFDLYDLSFHCKYRVTVKPHPQPDGRSHEAMLVLATPSCDEIASSLSRQEKPTCAPPNRHKHK